MTILKTLVRSASIIYWLTFVGFFLLSIFLGSVIYKASFGEYIYPIKILDSFADEEYIEMGQEINFTIIFDHKDSPCKVIENQRRIVSEDGDVIYAARPNINRNLGIISQCEWNGGIHSCNALRYSFPNSLGPGDYMVFNEIIVQCNPFFTRFQEVVSAPGIPITVCEEGDFQCLDR